MNGKRPKSTTCDNTTQTLARIETLTRIQAINVLKKLSTYPIVQEEVLKMTEHFFEK